MNNLDFAWENGRSFKHVCWYRGRVTTMSNEPDTVVWTDGEESCGIRLV